MSSDLRASLVEALGLEASAVGQIQRAYNDHKKYLSGRILKTPLPEEIHLLDENFPYWIKLETVDASQPTQRIGAKSKIVIPLLEAGNFKDDGYTFDRQRLKALLHLPAFLRNPCCIHENLRHAERGQGGIQGRYMYVQYLQGKVRKVAFTTLNAVLGEQILVTSFFTYRKWVEECAANPPIYVKPGSKCTCCL